MKKEVMDYFINLEDKAKKFNNIWDPIHNKHIEDLGWDEYSIDGIRAWVKGGKRRDNILGHVSSKLYKSLGIPTPQTALFRHKDINYGIFSASQDVKTLNSENLIVDLANESPAIKHLKKDYRHDRVNSKWDILYDEQEKSNFLKYMTEECFEELITIMLLDELRTDPDRHWGNYFMYATKGSNKYEGIIPIDLEFGSVFESLTFERFLHVDTYNAYSIYSCRDSEKNYATRINDILKLIHDGKLTQKQIEIIKKALEYGLDDEFEKVVNNFKLKKIMGTSETVYSMHRLWEYNRATVGKELQI